MECFCHHLRWEERASIGYYRRPQNKSGYNQMNRRHLKWRIFNFYSFKFIVYKSSEIIQNMHYFKVLILVLTFVNVRTLWVRNQKLWTRCVIIQHYKVLPSCLFVSWLWSSALETIPGSLPFLWDVTPSFQNLFLPLSWQPSLFSSSASAGWESGENKGILKYPRGTNWGN